MSANNRLVLGVFDWADVRIDCNEILANDEILLKILI